MEKPVDRHNLATNTHTHTHTHTHHVSYHPEAACLLEFWNSLLKTQNQQNIESLSLSRFLGLPVSLSVCVCMCVCIHIYRDLGVVLLFLDSLHCLTSPHYLRRTGCPLTSWYPWGRGGSILVNDSSSRAVKVSKWKLLGLFDSLRSTDCRLPGSTVRGILQAKILEWVAVPFSRGSSQPRD